MNPSKFHRKILKICGKPKTPKQIFIELNKDKSYSYIYMSHAIMELKDRGLLKRINGKGVVYVAKG